MELQEKLDYYFLILRENLGTDSWPEETIWEQRLKGLVHQKLQ